MATEFQYLTPAEFAAIDLSVSGVTNTALAEKHITHAEKIIDAYCGSWPRFYPELTGDVTSFAGTTLTADMFGTGFEQNYWAQGGLYVEATDGPGVGERRLITASSGNTVTVASGSTGWTGSTEIVIKQESVFPRWIDCYPGGKPYVPQRVKQAVAAQVAFGIAKGSEAFGLWKPGIVADCDGDVTSRTYGTGYSESRDARRVQGRAVWVAPQAQALLKGLVNSTGRLVSPRYRGRRFKGG